MAKIQDQLITFHNTIKVEEEDLRTSRDALLEKIKKSLKDNGNPVPALINQGSYIYGVGVEPTDPLEHDIDVGLEFDIASVIYSDAADIRDWVFKAVENHTDQVPDKKGPCIRVKYKKGYHVDLVCYSKYKTNEEKEKGTENHQLAMKDGTWRPSEPKKLKKYISDAMDVFDSTKVPGSGNQLQRTVRSLKRWNDLAMPFESDDKPVGLALLLYCIEHLQPKLDANGQSDDLAALESIALKAKNTIGNLIAKKPTQEFEDTFSKISSKGMSELKARFSKMYDVIQSVRLESSLEKACEKMITIFGEDFPKDSDPTTNASKDRKNELLTVVANASVTRTEPWSE